MTSVSHPLIADIAPARSSDRPEAPAREPRREDEKFSIPEVPQTATQRADISDAPVAPVAPIPARNDSAPETQVTAAPTQTTPPPEGSDTAPTLHSDAPGASAIPTTPSSGLIARIAGASTGNNFAGQPAAVSTTVAQASVPGTATASPIADQPASVQSGAPALNPQAQVGAANPSQQTLATAGLVPTEQPASPPKSAAAATATAPGAATSPASAATPPPAAAQQVAAAVGGVRPVAGGTTSSTSGTTDPKTTSAKNAVLDQQSANVEAPGVGIKKPATSFASEVNTAFSSTDTTAKPPLTQASAQIMAQAMASTPAIAAATPEAAAPSLTAPAPVTGDALGVSQSFSAEMRAAIDAPTQAAAYTARGAVTAQPAAEQIAMQITRAADQNIDRMTVHLKPAELGKVTIDLEVGPDNRMLAVISAERSETLDLLQRDSKSLEKALNDAGIETDSGSLEFSLKGDGDMAENGRDDDGKLHDGAVMLPGDIDATDAHGMPANAPLILPEGRIDIQV